MNGYIDMHFHILPNVDDGPSNAAEMKNMPRIAYEGGIRCIIATTHYHPFRSCPSPKVLRIRASLLRQAAHEIDQNFRIYLGCEIYFQQDLPELLKRRKILTMNRRHYILVEFSPCESYFHIRQGLQQLQNCGYEIILAHVERYSAIIANYKFASELHTLGIHLQINAGNICGKNCKQQRKLIKHLLDQNIVFCVGTDAHNTKDRAPYMHTAANYVTRYYGAETTRRLFFSNAMQMLRKV